MSLLANVKKGVKAKAPKIMLIGVEGVGKSTAGAKMPNPIFICGESGLVGPQFAETANFTPSSWEDILKFLGELITEEHEYKTIVIDTLDWIEPLLYAHVVKKAAKPDIKSIEDFGYGKGYEIAAQEFRRLITGLEKANDKGMSILILSHSQQKTVKNPLGEDYDHFEPKVNKKVAGLTKEFCDAILFAHFDVYTRKEGNKVMALGGNERIVETTHSAAWDAKNRYGLPETMNLDMEEIMAEIKKSMTVANEETKAKKAETKKEA